MTTITAPTAPRRTAKPFELVIANHVPGHYTLVRGPASVFVVQHGRLPQAIFGEMIRNFENTPESEMVPDSIIARMAGVTFAAIDRRKRDDIILRMMEAGPISVPDFVAETLSQNHHGIVEDNHSETQPRLHERQDHRRVAMR
jgi:hypothetical protein